MYGRFFSIATRIKRKVRYWGNKIVLETLKGSVDMKKRLFIVTSYYYADIVANVGLIKDLAEYLTPIQA